jgi:hypothetical protein
MKFLLACSITRVVNVCLIGFIVLTTPEGKPVWVAIDSIVAVIPEAHVGKGDTAIVTSGPTLYVIETPDQVMEKAQQNYASEGSNR